MNQILQLAKTNGIIYDSSLNSIQIENFGGLIIETIKQDNTRVLKPEHLQESLKLVKDSIIVNEIENYIVDTRKAKVFNSELLDYIIDDFIPTIARTGIKKIVYLKPIDVFAEAGIRRIIMQNGSTAKIKLFDDLVQANNWIYSPDK